MVKASKKKLMLMIMAVIMLIGVGIIGSGIGAEKACAASDNSFVLMAADDDGWVIQPEYVSYTQGQTIKDALLASGHSFQGLEQNYIQAIDGHVFNISYFYDGGEWELNAPASTIHKALVFTWRADGVYSDDEACLDLAVKLAGYADMEQMKKTYPSVKAAYKSAFDAMPAAKSAKAAQLLTAINDAEAQYDEWMAETPCNVTFLVTQGGSQTAATQYAITDEAGNRQFADQTTGTAALRSGSYTFVIDKGMDQVEGTFTIEKNEGAKTINAELPADPWFGSIAFGAESSSKWTAIPMDTSPDGNTITVYAPDASTGLYPKVAPGEAINNDEDKKTHRLYGDYIAADNKDYGDESVAYYARSWNSTGSSMAGLLAKGLTGRNDARLKVVYKDPNGHTQRQFKNLIIVRTPTLKGLTVSEPSGTVLELTGTEVTSFDTKVKEYTVTTVADELVIAGDTRPAGGAYGTYPEGYSIEVNGRLQPENGNCTVSVDNGDVITVKAKAANGQEDAYTIRVNKVAKSSLLMSKADSSVTAYLLTSTGSRIMPESQTATTANFGVAPGTYTWVGTLEEHYHTSGSITVPATGTTGTIATPVKEELIKDLYVCSGVNKPRYEIVGGKTFDWEDHAYTFAVLDNVNAFQIYHEADPKLRDKKGKLIRPAFLRMDTGGNMNAAIKSFTSNSTSLIGNQASSNFIVACEKNATMAYRVEYTVSDVTYYQEYILSTTRKPILQDISLNSVASGRSRTAALSQSEAPDEGFDYLVNEYKTSVPRGADELQIKVDYNKLTMPCETDFLIRVGDKSIPRPQVADSGELTIPLDPSKDVESVDIALDTGDPANVINTYSIEVNKTNPVRVEFDITPEDHNLTVFDNGLKEQVTPESDGSFDLMEGGTYTYTVTAYGHVGMQVTDYLATTSETIDIDLAEAPENDSLNPDLEADWPRFRFDANNNGVTDYLTPVEAEKTTLYWANKVGSGYSSGATGCPIIVGDYLYTYAGTSLIKINRYTGDVVDSATMATSSSFAINSPTYAEGMIFVGLNGKVQAFNAETLESLWVYTDPIGGQPNCPIAYHDGYIYTGYWQGEQTPANFVCMSVTDEDPTRTDEAKLAAWTVTDNGFYWAGAYVGPGASGGDRTYIVVGTDDGKNGYTTGSGNLISMDRKTGQIIDYYEGVCKGDIRSSISYDDGKYYFTSKGGYFCSIQLNEDGTFRRGSLQKLYLAPEGSTIWSESNPPMSTSTPCVYNGRAYVGVSGTGQFAAYSGHNITVIDLETFSIAYQVDTKGYPQTSGLLTTGYDNGDGTVYVYFTDNFTPGMIRVIADRPGQSEPLNLGQEERTINGETMVVDVAYTLWTPFGDQAQYAICSPISDEYGNIYFKNDSAYMMMIGATIDRLEVRKAPRKTTYRVGETFDPEGMVVIAHYSNGKSRDITKYLKHRDDQEPFTAEELGNQQIDLEFYLGGNMNMYQDRGGQAGQEYIPPTAFVNVTVVGEGQHVHEYGEPSYAWADDNSTCTATMSCTAPDCVDSDGSTITETVNADRETLAEVTCTEGGEYRYMASFTNGRFDDQSRSVIVDPLGHDWGEWNEVTPATEIEEGLERRRCSRDDSHVDERSIPRLKQSIARATVTGIAARTYTGKAHTHNIVVEVGGRTLTNGTDYGLAYRNNKNVGTASVTITGKGNYDGSVTTSFVINPKGTTISKVKAAKKGLTVKWKKQAAKMPGARITGYQIQCSMNSKFKSGNKTVTIKGYTKASRKVGGLKAKKIYYVKIRTYMKTGGKTYYSPWSGVKKIKTK